MSTLASSSFGSPRSVFTTLTLLPIQTIVTMNHQIETYRPDPPSQNRARPSFSSSSDARNIPSSQSNDIFTRLSYLLEELHSISLEHDYGHQHANIADMSKLEASYHC